MDFAWILCGFCVTCKWVDLKIKRRLGRCGNLIDSMLFHGALPFIHSLLLWMCFIPLSLLGHEQWMNIELSNC